VWVALSLRLILLHKLSDHSCRKYQVDGGCSCWRLFCDGGRVVVLSDSVVAVFAWFGDLFPSRALCVCVSFADRRLYWFLVVSWWLLVLVGWSWCSQVVGVLSCLHFGLFGSW